MGLGGVGIAGHASKYEASKTPGMATGIQDTSQNLAEKRSRDHLPLSLHLYLLIQRNEGVLLHTPTTY